LARVQQLLAILGGYALMPALKGIMTILTGDKTWLRVRPPLVALTDDGLAALERQVRAFGIDTVRD
jgi:4-hydroxy-tetrahydrodipicolinate synthase